MPKVSVRARAIKALVATIRKRFKQRAIDIVTSPICVEDEYDKPSRSFQDLLDMALIQTARRIMSQRYLCRPQKYRKSKLDRFQADLDAGDDENAPWLNEDEFIRKYRMSRENFYFVLDQIKNHPVFAEKYASGRKQIPVEYQLMCFLHFVGTEGTGANNEGMRNTFGISRGAAEDYRNRVATALSSLRDQYIKWPDEKERAQIAKRIGKEWDFPNCVAIADGTLFPLHEEPETDDAPDYHGRKYRYSLTTMVICDDRRKIRHYLAGWPGQAHDNRVFRNTKVALEPKKHFGDLQYLIGDSAFENDWFVVSACKKPRNLPIPRDHELFNRKMARLRIISEHTIGILKGRFPWLRCIRFKITEDKDSMRQILTYIDATVVLHNILLSVGEDDEWIEIDEDDISLIDEEARVPQEADLFRPLTPEDRKDQRRRDLLYYFKNFDPEFVAF